MKTNALRILDQLGIRYETRSYSVDPADLSAASVARKIDMPIDAVFKTLLLRMDGTTPVFAVVPGDLEVALKPLAAIAGCRRAEMMPLANVEPMTGYIRGGVTVVGAKKPFLVFIHETLPRLGAISVSAGARGLQIVLAPSDYLRCIEAVSGRPATVAGIAHAPHANPAAQAHG